MKSSPRFAALMLATSMLAASPAWAQVDEAIPSGEAGTNTGPLTPTDKIVARFMELDLDASEGVSREEYLEMVTRRAEERFQSMDADGDGEVTAEEFREFWKKRKAQWYRLRR